MSWTRYYIRKGVFIIHPNISHIPKTFVSIKDPELQRFILGLYFDQLYLVWLGQLTNNAKHTNTLIKH